MKNKMNVLWRLGLCLAALAGTLIVLGCPTEGEEEGADKPTVATAPGFYVGSSVEPVDLAIAEEAGAKDIVTQAFYWLRTGAEENGVYTIIVGEDINAELNVPNDGSHNLGSEGQGMQPGWIMYNRHTVNQALKTTVIIKSAGTAPKTIKLKNKGHLVHMGAVAAISAPGYPPDAYLPGYDTAAGQKHTLVLENIVLQGLSTLQEDAEDNNAALLYVGDYAVLEIKDGAKISGNAHVEAQSNNIVRGGGILMNKSARVVLDGGSIENNKAENTAPSTGSSDNAQAWGGGVSLSDGSSAVFILKRGTIKGNQSVATGTARGGGINNQTGSVYIYGGSITENTVRGGPDGGGIFSGYGGAIGYQFYYSGLYIYGGTISGNQAFAGSAARAIPGVFISTRGGSNNDRTLVLEGNPKIPDGVCFSGTNGADDTDPKQVIWIGKDMQGIKYGGSEDAIPLDFITAPANGATLLRWVNQYAGTLPVGKFVIRNLISADGTTGAPLGGSISADGKYTAP
jgi:hypothetical protein